MYSIAFMLIVLLTLLGVVYLQLSPPDIPQTFSTDFVETNNLNYSLKAEGQAYEDDAKELVYLERKDQFFTTLAIFNKMLYLIIQPLNEHRFCDCVNTTYKEMKYPLFYFVQDLKHLYFQNDTVEIWEPEGQGSVPDKEKDLIYFIVKKSNRNVPFKLSQKFLFQESLFYQNTTFSDFNPTTPDTSIFVVPDICKNIKCKTPPLHQHYMFSTFIWSRMRKP